MEKLAHLPELRFALGEPEVDTTSIDNAAFALESKAFFISRVGSDGFRIYHKATIRKAVNDRRASLDEDEEIKPTMKSLVKKEFERGVSIPFVPFPKDGSVIQDSPKLTLVLMDRRIRVEREPGRSVSKLPNGQSSMENLLDSIQDRSYGV